MLLVQAHCSDRSIAHTDCPGRMNRDAISLQKEKILYDTQRTPTKAKTLVVGAAQGSIRFDLSIVVDNWDVALSAMDRYSSWLRVLKFICFRHQAEAWG